MFQSRKGQFLQARMTPRGSKARRISGVAAAGLLSTGLAACSGDAGAGDAETITYSTIVNETSPHGLAAKEWMDQITERTDGAVEFEPYFAGALCDATNSFECVRDGRTDVAFLAGTWNAAQHPITGLADVPFQTRDIVATAEAFQQLYNENQAAQEEYTNNNLHLLFISPTNITTLLTKEPVDGLDDLDGMTVRAIGPMTAALEGLGVNISPLPAPEQYEAFQRGVVDGVLGGLDQHVLYRTHELGEHANDVGEYIGSYAEVHTAINADVWNDLDAKTQDVITEVSGDIAQRFVDDFLLPTNEQFCAEYEKTVSSFDRLEPSQDVEAWAEEWKTKAMDQWVATATEAGVQDAEDLATQFSELVAKNESMDRADAISCLPYE